MSSVAGLAVARTLSIAVSLVRIAIRRGILIAACTVVAAAGFACESARAQGKLEGRYVVTLAGITIGQGGWAIDIWDDQYRAAASGMTTGILRVFASGEGSSAAQGYVNAGNLIPSSYAASITADKKTEELRIIISNGNVKEYSVDPPSQPYPDRIPITDAHRRGVTDPMSAALMHVSGIGDLMSPEACNRTLPIFDGRLRYDLTLAYKRMEKVKAEKGYEGPSVVCAAYFTPLGGYIPDRPAIKYLIAQRDMEVWLAPIAGTRVVVPFRMVVPTPLGTGVLEATQFVSAPQPPRAESAKLQ